MDNAILRLMPTWDEAADWYLEMVGNGEVGFNRLAASVALDLLGECNGLRVLDVGCGEGHVARAVATRGADVVAVEPVKRLLAAACDHENEQPLGIDYRSDRAEELSSVPDSSVWTPCSTSWCCTTWRHSLMLLVTLGAYFGHLGEWWR